MVLAGGELKMTAENIDFILPLPFSVNIGKGLISETNKDIENSSNAKRFGGDIFYVLESEVQIGEVNAYGYVLFNKKTGRRRDKFVLQQTDRYRIRTLW